MTSDVAVGGVGIGVVGVVMQLANQIMTTNKQVTKRGLRFIITSSIR
jgi:hypothetical protein